MSTRAWLALARDPPIVRRSLHVALVVGTVLTLINQGDSILAHEVDAVAMLKILLTYLVPYCVSTWAAVQALRASGRSPE